MKKAVLTLAIIALTAVSTTNAQYSVTTPETKKVVTHDIGNHYDVVYTDAEGRIIKEGHYFKVDDKLKPHGIWKLYNEKTFELITTAKYDKGEQLWVETKIDGKVIRVDQNDLTIKKLEDRIASLEKQIKDMEDNP